MRLPLEKHLLAWRLAGWLVLAWHLDPPSLWVFSGLGLLLCSTWVERQNPLEPEHAQEGSILEGAEQPPTPIDAQGAKSPLPPTVAEHPYDDRPQGDGEE